jgi:hypothetical protein
MADLIDRRHQERTDRGSGPETGAARTFARTMVMVVLAALAILALLPAALAAHAASTV